MITSKTWRIILFLLLGASIIEIFVFQYQDSAEREAASAVVMPTKPVTTKVPKPASAKTNPKLYTDLVTEYSGRHIQFDIACQAIPNNVTYKNGTSVMFDNRSGDARSISVGGTIYYLAGYGYKIITLSSKTLPKTLLISCGAAVNVGQILLQK